MRNIGRIHEKQLSTNLQHVHDRHPHNAYADILSHLFAGYTDADSNSILCTICNTGTKPHTDIAPARATMPRSSCICPSTGAGAGAKSSTSTRTSASLQYVWDYKADLVIP
jgi:hypothetical protein